MHQRNDLFYLFCQKQTDALAREAQKNRKAEKQAEDPSPTEH
jgi:hypothetical protein